MTDDPITLSPFYGADDASGPLRAVLAELAEALPRAEQAAETLRAGSLPQDQHDQLLAEMLDNYASVLRLILGRPS